MTQIACCAVWLQVQWSQVQWSQVQWLQVQWLQVQWLQVQWSQVQWLQVQWLRFAPRLARSFSMMRVSSPCPSLLTYLANKSMRIF